LASAFANNGLFDFELGIFQKKKMREIDFLLHSLKLSITNFYIKIISE
jgi:hypothetical protein